MLKGPWLQIILSLLTTIPGIVAQVEAADPKVPGEGKKLIVMDQLTTALQKIDPVIGPMLAAHPAIQAGLSTAVDVAVDLFNGSASIVVAGQKAGTIPTATPTSPVLGASAARTGA